jgi:uncharacterized membrane protein YkoI
MTLTRSLAALSAVAMAACAAPKAETAAADTMAAAAKPVLLDVCVDAVMATKKGKIVKLEGKTEQGVHIYEFDVRGDDGEQYDIECDAAAGKIVEIETEVASAKDPRFAAKAKVSQAEAEKTALAAYPGTITEVEFEIEPNGDASYEFDILMADGKEMKVEVDAATGQIVEANAELYQIGIE